jgi:plastocyanin
MRRVFALLLLAPLLVNCSDATTPVAAPGASLNESGVPAEWDVPTEEDVLTEEVSPLASTPSSAVMVLGNPDAGTPYPPQTHDQSLHGKDRMIPGTVVIDAGGTVTFQVNRGHRVAIYDDGTRPQDIKPNPGPFVLDPTNRLALQPGPTATYKYTFREPGRYLVICAISRHFFVANMYGWVIVR